MHLGRWICPTFWGSRRWGLGVVCKSSFPERWVEGSPCPHWVLWPARGVQGALTLPPCFCRKGLGSNPTAAARTSKISSNLVVDCPYWQSRSFLLPGLVPYPPWRWVWSCDCFGWSIWKREAFAGMTHLGLYKSETKLSWLRLLHGSVSKSELRGLIPLPNFTDTWTEENRWVCADCHPLHYALFFSKSHPWVTPGFAMDICTTCDWLNICLGCILAWVGLQRKGQSLCYFRPLFLFW